MHFFCLKVSVFTVIFSFLMLLRLPRSTRRDTRHPYTTLFRSARARVQAHANARRVAKNKAEPYDAEFAEGDYVLYQDVHRHRSEVHTSELQSLMRISYAVFCLEKKKKPRTHSYESHCIINKKTHN